MKFLSARLPRISYIAFELVRVDVNAYINDSKYRAEHVSFIRLMVNPEQLNYKLVSRDAITQTQSQVFRQIYDFQPEQVTFTGTFGSAGNGINTIGEETGWTRLKAFENEIVRASKEIDSSKYIYAVNFYDFQFQRFGTINIQSWDLNANAQTNTNLITYRLQFQIIGNLIDVNAFETLLPSLIQESISSRNDSIGDKATNIGSALAVTAFTTQVLSAVASVDKSIEDGISSINDTLFGSSKNAPTLQKVEGDIY